MRLDVRSDLKEVEALFRELGPGVQRAAARALNDTIRTVRAEGARAIKREHRGMKIGDIKRAMVMKQAFPKRLQASVDVEGKPLSFTLFRPHQLKRGGVKVTLGKQRITLKYKGRKTFRIAKYGNEVFARRFATGRQVRRLRGPSLPGVFRAREEEFGRIAREKLPKAFRSRLQFEIDKAAKVARARAGAPSGAQIRGFVEGQFRLPPGALSG